MAASTFFTPAPAVSAPAPPSSSPPCKALSPTLGFKLWFSRSSWTTLKPSFHVLHPMDGPLSQFAWPHFRLFSPRRHSISIPPCSRRRSLWLVTTSISSEEGVIYFICCLMHLRGSNKLELLVGVLRVLLKLRI